MTRKQLFAIGFGVLCAGAVASAQTTYPYPQVIPGEGSIPGTTSPILGRLPLALPQVGMTIGTRPGSLTRPLQPNESPTQAMGNLISPYPTPPVQAPGFWDNLERRWFSMFSSDDTNVNQSVYVPGISRRNRERDEGRRDRRRD